MTSKTFFELLFVIIPRRGIFFHKTNFRGKLKDSQRVKVSYFDFSFIKSQMKLFSKGESVLFLNPTLFLNLFFWKKKIIKPLLETKICPIFFPLGRLQYF